MSYGIATYSNKDALDELLDPITDRASIVAHIIPHLEQLKGEEPTEYAAFLGHIPSTASLILLKPEAGILSRLSSIIATEERLLAVMSALGDLDRGLILAQVFFCQSDDVYPALVKVLQEGTDDNKVEVATVLGRFLDSSAAARVRFMQVGGIKALLDLIPSDNFELSIRATSTLASLLTNFPEGVQPMIDAGAIPILESMKDDENISETVGYTLGLLEELKTASAIGRIEFTPEAYAAFGKKLPDPEALEQLKKNLESSQDEKQLAIVGGLTEVLTDLVRSTSEPKPLLQVLQTLFVFDDQPWDGHDIAVRVAGRCRLSEALKPLVESEDKEVSDLATNIQSALTLK